MRSIRLTTALALVTAAGFFMAACSGQTHDSEALTSPTSPSSSATTGASSSTSTTTTTGSGTSTTPTAPTTSTATVAYTQDIKAIVTSGCTRCHGNFATYSGIMSVVTAGSASSKLVTKTQSGGSMYQYLPSDRATNSALIKTWVMNGAPENR
jgi:hypothetical protein